MCVGGGGGGGDRNEESSNLKMLKEYTSGFLDPSWELTLESQLVQILISQPEFELLAPKTCFIRGPTVEEIHKTILSPLEHRGRQRRSAH